jgi:hypothetical protein
LLTAGGFWDIDTKGTSMLKAGVSNKELGIPEDRNDERAEYSRGSKPLFPKELSGPLLSCEVRLRQTIGKYGYKIEGFPNYVWVPATAFPTWKARHDEIVREYYGYKAALITNYDAVVEQNRQKWTRGAEKAYKAIVGPRPDARFWKESDAELQHAQRQWDEGMAEYVTEVVERALAQMPSKEQLRAGLQVVLKPAIIEDIRDVEQANLKAEELRLAQEQVRLETDRIKAMRAAQMEAAREQLADMASPWDTIIHTFGVRLNKAVQELAASIGEHGYLTGKAAEGARNLRQLYDVLAAARNETTEAALDKLDQALAHQPHEPIITEDKDGKKTARNLRYDPAKVMEALEAIAETTIESVEFMKRRSPQEWADLEL